MMDLAMMFREGGWWMYPILGLGMAAVLGSVLPLLLATRWRIPAVLFLALPLTVVSLGQVGSLAGLSMVRDALTYVDPVSKASVAAGGIAECQATILLATATAGLAFATTGIFAGLGAAFGGGPEARWRWDGPAVAVLVGALGGLLMLAGAGIASGSWPSAVLIASGPVVAGIGGGLASARWSDAEGDAARLAAARVMPVVCGLLASFCFGVFAHALGVTQVFAAIAPVAPEDRGLLLEAGFDELRVLDLAAIGAAGIAALTGVVPVGLVARHLDARAWVGGGIAGAAIVVLLTLEILRATWFSSIVQNIVSAS